MVAWHGTHRPVLRGLDVARVDELVLLSALPRLPDAAALLPVSHQQGVPCQSGPPRRRPDPAHTGRGARRGHDHAPDSQHRFTGVRHCALRSHRVTNLTFRTKYPLIRNSAKTESKLDVHYIQSRVDVITFVNMKYPYDLFDTKHIAGIYGTSSKIVH